MRTGFSATTTVNGESVPNYALEKTNNSTTLGKMMVATNNFLKQSKAPGVGQVVGTYDDTVVGEACHQIFNGKHNANIYGITIPSQYYERAGLL